MNIRRFFVTRNSIDLFHCYIYEYVKMNVNKCVYEYVSKKFWEKIIKKVNDCMCLYDDQIS